MDPQWKSPEKTGFTVISEITQIVGIPTIKAGFTLKVMPASFKSHLDNHHLHKSQ